ncbi:ArnT family glycosyltransferase [Pelagibacterium xiamenense]|uniref:ArnT family glycosyltransferase n=1 Tax=Pelagibacterium xiamenense TaxID=2901140 RepID=UPI001E4EF9D5|nr:glycosyltransferase family 39 protein [Pelagibacterium xiamenense]MCD7059206.1 glycosyltransferase family 39 protein [Pelagibacterium xiamenense]
MGARTANAGPFTPAQATLILIAVTFVLRAIGAASIGWGTGEAYYLASARVPALSYFDQPPLSLWTIWATLTLTGSENVLVIRLPFIAMFAVSTWLVYLIGKRLHSPLGGFYAALIVNACVLFSLSIGSWTQPDAPMLLFWLATVLVLVDIFFGKGGARPYRSWALAGALLGLTFLSKYHAAFLVAGTGLFILLNRDARRWLFHPAPYLAVLIALVIFSPVIIWNAQNGWASFGFQGGRALAEQDLHWDRLLRMIWGQLLYMVPWLALPALVVGARAVFAGPQGRYPGDTPAGAAALMSYIGWPPVLFFTIVALWSDTQFHFHWQAPGYLMLFILMGAWAANREGRGVRFWLYGSALLTFVILALLISHAATGWGRHVVPGDWEDPTALQLPWTELGEELEAYGAFEAPKTFVGAINWIDCGYVDTQVGGRVPFLCMGTDIRNLGFTADPEALIGWDAYVVARTGRPDALVEHYGDAFEGMEHVGTVSVARGGVAEIDDIQVFRATGFLGAP